jgi:DNA-binding GntR family transcriptional regulator
MTKKLGDLWKEKDTLAFSKLNMQIHEKIWGLSGNNYLCQALSTHYEKLIILVNYFIFSRDPQVLSMSHKTHIDLLEVLEERDLTKVKKVVTQHWNWILKYLT